MHPTKRIVRLVGALCRARNAGRPVSLEKAYTALATAQGRAPSAAGSWVNTLMAAYFQEAYELGQPWTKASYYTNLEGDM